MGWMISATLKENGLDFHGKELIDALQLSETCRDNNFQPPAIIRGRFVNSLSTSATNSRTMPKSLFNPTCAWLILAGIFRSPNEFLLGTMPVATPMGGGCIAWPSEAAWGELGLLEGDGLGVIVSGDDDINLESTEGCRSSDPTPTPSDLDVEMTERSEAIDCRGSSGSWSRGSDGPGG
jgi:hypothetical protein